MSVWDSFKAMGVYMRCVYIKNGAGAGVCVDTKYIAVCLNGFHSCTEGGFLRLWTPGKEFLHPTVLLELYSCKTLPTALELCIYVFK